jgi:hypothetical protein
MKCVGLLAISIGIVASVGVGPGYAGENEKGCSLATLNGQYPFGGSFTLFPPAFGVTAPSTGSSAGYHIFNGDGTGADFVTFSLNGIDQHAPSPVATTYTLNSDCTGTFSVKNGPNFDIFVAVDGSQLASTETDPGAAAAGVSLRVGSSKRAD